MVGYMEPTLSLSEAYHAAQTWLNHVGAAPERVDEPVAGVIEMQGGGLFSRIRFDRSTVGQAAILALMNHVDESGDTPVLFSVSGFSQSAEAFAENHHVALFTIDETGDVVPQSAAARQLMPEEHYVPPFSTNADEHRAEEFSTGEDQPGDGEAESGDELESEVWRDCPSCGTSHHRGAAVCVSCGADLNELALHLKVPDSAPAAPAGTPVPSAGEGRPTLRCRTCGSGDIELLNNG